MLAVRLHAPGEELRVEQVPLLEPTGTEVRLRIAGCGVCRTDLHIVDGTQARVELPLTLGHEVSGFIERAGPEARPLLEAARLRIGDPVLAFGGWGCGLCRECAAGAEQRCPGSRAPGFQADGGYAEAMLVPHPRHLVALGDLDPMRAAPLADAGVTPYRAVVRAARWLTAGARVLVIGAGVLGQFALQYLRVLPAAGADLFVVVRDLDQARLRQAYQLGADATLIGGDPEATRDALGGPAEVVVDLVGSDETLRHAASVVAPDGLVLLIGEAGGTLPFGFDRLPVESWLTTVAWGSAHDLREVVRLAAGGQLHWEVQPLPLVEAASAHARLRAGTATGRIVLVPESAR